MSSESRRKTRIRRKIKEKRAVQKTCETARTKLKRERNTQEQELYHWEREYQICMDQPITSLVFIPNLFEGDCSRQTERRFPESVQLMYNTKLQTTELIEDLGDQIVRLEQYIDQLEEEIQNLYDDL